jgi:putative ABC transport system permease protein
MLDWDRWQEVFATLSHNRVRTFLTACGVFWGILLLVVMLGFSKGLWVGVTRSMQNLTNNVVYVWGQVRVMPYRGMRAYTSVALDTRDIEPVRQVPGVKVVAPGIELGGWQAGVPVTRAEFQGHFRILGDYPEFRNFERFHNFRGRLLNERDMQDRRKVAVIGDRVREVLFPDGGSTRSPIGEYICVRGVYFLVIGTYETTWPGEGGERALTTIHIPFTTFQSTYRTDERVGYFAVELEPEAPAVATEQALRQVLARNHSVHPEDPSGVGAYNSAKDVERARRLFAGIEGFTWFVSVATLLAGLLGVSNIMLISVKERTSEFGVRKALGATPWAIVGLVLQEAFVLTALAGYAGLVVGVFGLHLASGMLRNENGPLGPPSIELGTAVAAALVVVIGGVIAGVAPARRAVAVPAVEALRAE